jgi:hypothetical protein
MSVRAVLRCALAVALGCGLAVACTSSSHPPATPATSETGRSETTSASSALGDFRTLDPCSLVDPAALASLGRVSFGDPQSLDYCVVRLATPRGDVELHVGELVAGAALTLVAPPGPGGCADHVTFADEVVLMTAATASGPSTTTTCAAVQAALRGVLARISAGAVAHRSDPKGSFVSVDACAVLTPKVVLGSALSMGNTRIVPHPAGHQCEYVAPSTYVALVLAAAYARFDGGPGSTTLVIAHHQVVLVPEQPDGRAGECVGYGPHIAFPSRSGQPAMEMAELHVALPTGATDAAACAAVRRLAGPVFARLP